MTKNDIQIQVSDLSIGYGNYTVLHDLNFKVNKGDIFIIMGGSGSGKSTLLRAMTGLIEPKKGKIIVGGVDFTDAREKEKTELIRQYGILYQSGALFSSMTVGENIALPLQQYTDYTPRMIQEMVALKLSLVGLQGFEDFYPSELSGGMKKRAGLARALALDPQIVYFDEPSAGLDPISSRLLDDLILDLNQNLGMTIVVVTHELPSIFAIGNNAIYLDNKSKTVTGWGSPKELLKNPPNADVLKFLTRGEK